MAFCRALEIILITIIINKNIIVLYFIYLYYIYYIFLQIYYIYLFLQTESKIISSANRQQAIYTVDRAPIVI